MVAAGERLPQENAAEQYVSVFNDGPHLVYHGDEDATWSRWALAITINVRKGRHGRGGAVAEPRGRAERGTSGNGARAPGGNGAAPGSDLIAALDLGTNNCRLLIARPAADGFRVIDGFSRIVRLGEGVDRTGVLSEAAMSRAVAALKVCANKLRRRRVTRARYVATEAARRAANCDEFLARVKDETGLAIEIISSREEAELTLIGCLPLLDERIPYGLVFDVGGGSAEIVWLRLSPGEQAEILGWVSLPCGVVTLTERHGSNDFSPAAYRAVVAEIEDMLRPFEERHAIRAALGAGEAQMLGTAGTVTTIAGVNMGLKRYNRSLVDGSWLSFDAVATVSGNLAASTYAERAAHPSIGHSRADLVVAGCAVLEAVCRTWPAGRLRVADRGVREGILLQMAADVAGDRAAAGSPSAAQPPAAI